MKYNLETFYFSFCVFVVCCLNIELVFNINEYNFILYKLTVDGVAGRLGMHVARPVGKAYNAGPGIVTTQHLRLADNIASGTVWSIRPALTYNATVLPLSTIHHDCTQALEIMHRTYYRLYFSTMYLVVMCCRFWTSSKHYKSKAYTLCCLNSKESYL